MRHLFDKMVKDALRVGDVERLKDHKNGQLMIAVDRPLRGIWVVKGVIDIANDRSKQLSCNNFLLALVGEEASAKDNATESSKDISWRFEDCCISQGLHTFFVVVVLIVIL